MTTPARRHSLLLLSFASIYLVWGTSFAATKFMVLGLPPFLAGAARFAVAGLLLGLLAAALGQPLPRRARDWWHVLVMALFQVVASSGGNALAMRHIASNQSALLNASSALWIPLVGALGARGHPLTLRVGAGIAIGLAGLALLLWPRDGFSVADFGWQLLAVGACLAWALGTLYYRGIRTRVPMLMFLGAEMLVGGAVLAVAGLGLGEGAEWRYDPTALAALAFLMLFSSCLAYTAFGYLMVHTTPARLSTYAYVNPVIAALTGWWLLGERLSGTQLAGTGIILVGVVIVSLPDAAAGAPAPPPEPTG
ncbi:MAG: EamA family transporter [Proteobacteria bacterium]|nr:EamA family transporter [Pseudomonadota bacterium]